MRRLRQLLDVARQLSRPMEVQPAGCKSGRGFSDRPGRVDEYSTYYRKPDTISTRAQAQQTAEATQSAPAEALTSAAGQSTTAADATDDMRRAGAQSASAWMFPWEKRQMDGSGPLRTWERIYWGGFVTALSLFLFSRLNNKSSNAADPEAAQKAAEELEAKRRDAARMILAGKSFTEGMDAFEGLSPQQIQEYVGKAAGGATSKDPFEGMSPEEINEYLEQHDTAPM